jgi:hypothetical protein
MLACAALVAIGVGACDGDNGATGVDRNRTRSGPNNMASASQVDTARAAAVSEAFDEPLGMQEVLNIIRPFLAG